MLTAYTCITGPRASLIVDPEAMSLILAWSHTFVEFDHEIFSTVILLLMIHEADLKIFVFPLTRPCFTGMGRSVGIFFLTSQIGYPLNSILYS